jgi:hypothetical protein
MLLPSCRSQAQPRCLYLPSTAPCRIPYLRVHLVRVCGTAVPDMIFVSYVFVVATQMAIKCFATATVIIAYTNSNCTDPSLQLFGPDNGDCQQTLDGVASFRIAALDAACVGMISGVHVAIFIEVALQTHVLHPVTVYGVDSPYCDVNDRWVANLNQCYSNASISQYTIDRCEVVANASSALPFPLSTSTTPSSSPPSYPSTASSRSSSPSTIASGNASDTPQTSSASGPGFAPSSSGSNKTNDGSGNSLSIQAQIAIGVVIPSISIIVAIIFGIRAWHNRK